MTVPVSGSLASKALWNAAPSCDCSAAKSKYTSVCPLVSAASAAFTTSATTVSRHPLGSACTGVTLTLRTKRSWRKLMRASTDVSVGLITPFWSTSIASLWKPCSALMMFCPRVVLKPKISSVRYTCRKATSSRSKMQSPLVSPLWRRPPHSASVHGAVVLHLVLTTSSARRVRPSQNSGPASPPLRRRRAPPVRRSPATKARGDTPEAGGLPMSVTVPSSATVVPSFFVIPCSSTTPVPTTLNRIVARW